MNICEVNYLHVSLLFCCCHMFVLLDNSMNIRMKCRGVPINLGIEYNSTMISENSALKLSTLTKILNETRNMSTQRLHGQYKKGSS